jgi:hypothetical protein
MQTAPSIIVLTMIMRNKENFSVVEATKLQDSREIREEDLTRKESAHVDFS